VLLVPAAVVFIPTVTRAESPAGQRLNRAEVDKLLVQARQAMAEGNLDQADVLVAKAEASGIRYPLLHFGPTPAKVRFELTRAQRDAGIEPSVGSVGDSYDNALAETINGLYKAEVIHQRGPWRSFEAVEFATLEWIDWFNNRQLLEPIGYIPPAEAEQRYYATLDQPVMAA